MSKLLKIRQFNFLEFDPKLLCLGVIPTEFPNESRPVGYKSMPGAFASHKLQAALNGPLFGWSKSEAWKKVHSYDKTQSMFLESAHFQKNSNINFGPTKLGSKNGMTLGVKEQVTIVDVISNMSVTTLVPYSGNGWIKDDTTLVAIQLPFSLVISGKPTSFLTSSPSLEDRTHRPALGVTKNGTFIMGGGYGSCMELARALVDAGAKRAGYLDGGGSFHFMVAQHREEHTNNKDEDDTNDVPVKNIVYGPPRDRPVASWILVLAESDDQVLV